MDEEVQERQQVTVGKPLVSKLSLHEPRSSSRSVSSDFSLDTLSIAQSCSSAEILSSVGSGSNTRSHYAQMDREPFTIDSRTSSKSTNMPEETDSPEVYDGPEPLDACKSLPHSQAMDTNYKCSDM